MKKAIAITICLLLILSLAACGGKTDGGSEQLITRSAAETAPAAENTPAETAAPAAENTPAETAAPTETQAPEAPAASLGHYVFISDGVSLLPGEPFDPAALPEAQSVYEVPSCAIEGTDNVYTYNAFELTAFNDGSGEIIYSILLTDPNTTTPEGLALGDTLEKMESLYGTGYTKEGNGITYTGDGQLLCIIAQGDTVASIEYRAIVK